MQKTIYLILVIGIGCFSCQQQPTETLPIVKVDVDNSCTINIDDIAENITCENLTFPDSTDGLLGEITDIFPFREYLVLHDYYEKAIHLFRLNGEWVNTLNKAGRGPGEYLNIEVFTIDHESEQIIIYDRERGCFGFYSLPDFKYIKSDPAQKYITSFACIKKGKWLTISDQQLTPKQPHDGIEIYNPRKRTYHKMEWPYSWAAIELSYARTFSYINDKIYYAHPHIEPTIYDISSSKIQPVLKIDFGKYHGDEKIWNIKDGYQFNEFATNNKVAFMPHIFFSNEKLHAFLFFFMYNIPPKPYFHLYDKQNQKNYTFSKIKFEGIEMPHFKPIGIFKEKYVCLIYPHDCTIDEEKIKKSPLSRLLAKKIKESKDEGTPVLFMFTPKIPTI